MDPREGVFRRWLDRSGAVLSRGVLPIGGWARAGVHGVVMLAGVKGTPVSFFAEPKNQPSDLSPHGARGEPASGRADRVAARSRLDVAPRYDCASPKHPHERLAALVSKLTVAAVSISQFQRTIGGQDNDPPVRLVLHAD